MRYVILTGLWIAFCVIHSALISTTVTDFMRSRLKDRYRFYPLLYGLSTIALLLALGLYTDRTDEQPLIQWSGALAAVPIALFVASGLLMWSASNHYDMLKMVGIRQLMKGPPPTFPASGGKIDDSGVLGMVRHPIYAAMLIAFWARDITPSVLVVNVVLSVYMIVGTMLEERRLSLEFGGAYEEYKKNVSMLFPAKWLIRAVT